MFAADQGHYKMLFVAVGRSAGSVGEAADEEDQPLGEEIRTGPVCESGFITVLYKSLCTACI